MKEIKTETNMKEIEFKDLKNYNDNNSVVLLGMEATVEDVNKFFKEVKFFTNGKECVELAHLSDNVKGDDGRYDLLVITNEEGSFNPIVRLMLNHGGVPVKWTSDFIDNYKEDYISQI